MNPPPAFAISPACRLWGCAALLVCLVAAQSVNAVYRCVDDAGNISFTQLPCAPGQEAERMSFEGDAREARIDPAVCEEIRRLAQLIFPYVREEESILEIYDNLGGRAGLSAGVTSAINYVYNFRYNPQARAEVVVRLTHEKCLQKGFGVLRKSELPDWSRFRYATDNADTGKNTGNEVYNGSSLCDRYSESIRELEKKMQQAQNKSEELRLQADKEHMEHLRRDNCIAR